ncbi:MAG TPA: MBL fold metallo-hydrolase [Verrucomicrobiae bacterium]|nr:MBL fold metallo-hydrolase [Verrucomicrobiae bacterium]
MKSTLTGWFPAFGLATLLLALAPSSGPADDPPSPNSISTEDGALKIVPINHATLALQWKGKTILVDPVGGAKVFRELPKPDLILVTDIHGDHLNKETLADLTAPETKLVCPAAVADQLTSDLRKHAIVLANGQATEPLGIKVEAIPMYNLTSERLKFHTKGRGNGYVVTIGGKRLYLSGDTEDIPEMLALKNIDVAFVCMNLPYTMTVEQAARAVRAFKPKVVYPYHYRGSDLNKFKELVGTDGGVEVRLRDWYAKAPNQ